MSPAVLAIALFFARASADPNFSDEGPQFDDEGHLIAYNYPDGTQDQYTYDTSWRIIVFTGRDGATTIYVYDADGNVRTISVPKTSN